MKLRLVLIALLSLILIGAACAASLRASSSGRNFDIKVGDLVFARDAGVTCSDQLLTALKNTRPFARTLGPHALLCAPNRGSINGTYSVRISEFGVIVQKAGRIVFSRQNT